MKHLGVRYCGGCNPVIDRTKLVKEIRKTLPPEFSLESSPSSNPWDVGILVCGCLTSCADKPDLKHHARRWIIVAGNTVDHCAALEKELAGIVVSKVKTFK